MNNIICGKNSVFDALKNGIKITKIFTTIKDLNLKTNLNISINFVDKKYLDDLTNNLNHQGIVAIVEDNFNYVPFEKILLDNPKIILILDHIEDTGNFGAIIRSANAFGVNHIIIPDRRSAEVNSTVLKTSSGGFVNMKIAKLSSLQAAIEKLKKKDYWIYGSSLEETATNFVKINYNYPLAIIIGNESKGISKTLKNACDHLVYIPMKGTVQSLNVSVATGILLFELNKN